MFCYNIKYFILHSFRECMETIKIIDSPERLLSAGSSGDAEDPQK